MGPALSWADVVTVTRAGLLTLLRVTVLIALASLVWVPVGVWGSLRPRLTQFVQPVAQFLAAFPASLLFPVAVFLIVRFGLAPKLWLSPLMILGTQWYILFNVIASVTAFPGNLREAATSFRVRRGAWWRNVMLPGVFPYYVTGAITAAGHVFAQASDDERKGLFREHFLQSVPLAVHTREVLDEREGHRAPREQFELELQDHLNQSDPDSTLRTIIDWGRCAGLFSYEDHTRTFCD